MTPAAGSGEVSQWQYPTPAPEFQSGNPDLPLVEFCAFREFPEGVASGNVQNSSGGSFLPGHAKHVSPIPQFSRDGQ